MTLYRYKAAAANGEIFRDSADAPSLEALTQLLDKRNLTLLRLIEEDAQPKAKKGGKTNGRFRSSDIAIISRQLATMLRAGVPVSDSISTIIKQLKPEHRDVFLSISRDVESGTSFSESLKKYPRIFSRVYVATIAAAEKVGSLESALSQLSGMMLWERTIFRKIWHSLQYPLTLVTAMIIGVIVLQQAVIPQFSSVFNQLGGELPLATKILMYSSEFAGSYWWLVLGVTALCAVGTWKAIHTKRYRNAIDKYILDLPFIGTVLKQMYLARFARMMELLFSNGLQIPDILKTLECTIGNRYIAQQIREMREGVTQGQSLGNAVSTKPSFSPIVKNMLDVGEKSSDIANAMHTVSEFYDEETDQAIEQMTQWIEPVLTLVLAVFVLFLALAVFLPWWDLTGLYQQ